MLHFLKKNLFCIIFYTIIASFFAYLLLVSVTPSTRLMGWDNFSVSLDLKINAFRTLFSTWRDYRGLGVPSDSESVDIFRIALQFFLSIFLPPGVIDQVYYVLLYLIGITGAYFLALEVFSTVKGSIKEKVNLKYASIIVSVLYGFNYHVLETFLLPVAMYPARYAFFPLILLFFIRPVIKKSLSNKDVILFVIFNLLGSTAYLTATVFITLGIFLFLLFPSFLSSWKKYFIYGLSILLLNSFWVFPFINYTIQKSSVLPKASSFVSVNESLLNKPADLFSWNKLLIYDPLTLSRQALPFKALDSDEKVSIHELLNADLDFITTQLLLFPSTLALIGIVSVLWFSWKTRTMRLFWPITLVFSILFLLRKSLPPLGFVYQLFSNNIPLFDVVFRFSGAKFYALLLIGMSLLGGWGFLLVSNFMPKKFALNKVSSTLMFLTISVLVVFPFRSFLQEGLFDSLVKVEVPAGYVRLASDLNSNENSGRVLHLPVDQYSYWKSYKWGYFGSSFFNFMIDAPFLDRTFEPASLENDYYFQQLQNEVIGSILVTDKELQERASRLRTLFQKTGTEYIVFDSSVNIEIESEKLKAWGQFNQNDFSLILEKMSDLGFISLKKQYQISGDDTLILYQVKGIQSQARFISQAENVDPALENGFSHPLLEIESDFIQSDTMPFKTYPFWQPKNQITIGKQLEMAVDLPHSNQVNYVTESNNDSLYQDVYVSRENDSMVVYFQPKWLPVNYDFNKDFTSQIEFENKPELFETSSAILINGTVVELPRNISSSPTYVGTFFTKTGDQFEIISLAEENKVEKEQISLTKEPNCNEDRVDGYDYSFNNETNKNTKVVSKSGSTCLSLPLLVANEDESDLENFNFFFKATVEYRQHSKSESDNLMALTMPTEMEEQIGDFIGSQQLFRPSEICLFDINTGTCLNNLDELPPSSDFLNQNIWTQIGTSNPQVQALIIVDGNQGETTEFELANIKYQVYTTSEAAQIPSHIKFPAVTPITYSSSEKISLSIPLPSEESNSVSVSPCNRSDANGTRQVVLDDTKNILLYTENCPASISHTVSTGENQDYLWHSTYKLFYGRHPQLIVTSNGETIYSQYISRFNEYPNIPGFKQLEVADRFWWTGNDYQTLIQNEVSRDNYQQEAVLIQSPQLKDTKNLTFSLNSFGEGLNFVGVGNQGVAKIPTYWSNLAIENGDSNIDFSPATVTNLQKVLPSIWKVSVQGDNQVGAEEGNYLLEFGQAYDNQWNIYKTDSALEAFFGIGKLSSTHVKVNGWANGWIIPHSEIDDEPITLVVLYWPERLTIIGWLTTLATVAVLLLFASKKKVRQRKISNHFSDVRMKLRGN